MAGQRSGQGKSRANGRHRRGGGVEPYKWLGAGAVALGLGVAVANGSGIAHADEGAGSAPSASASQDDRGGSQESTNDDDNQNNKNDEDNEPTEDNGPTGDGDTDEDDTDEDDETPDLDDTDELDDDTELDAEDDLGTGDELGAGDFTATHTAESQRALTFVDEEPAAEPEPIAEVDPIVPESPVSAVLPELVAPVGVNTDPEVPPPPVAPTLNELVVAAYRPANQRGTGAAPASAQTTSESAPSTTQPFAAAAAPSGVIDRVSLGDALPHTVVVSPDGRTVYVVTTTISADGGSVPTSTVYGIDTRTNRPVGDPLAVGYVPQTGFSTTAKPLAFSPDGKRVYVSSMSQGADGQLSGRIDVIDAASGQAAGAPVELVNTAATGLVVSPDGRRLYTANADSTVTVIDLQHNNTPVATVPIGIFSGPGSPGGAPLDIVISQNDAQTVYVFDYAERAVYVLDPATSTTDPDPVLVDGYPLAMALSPDGSRLFVNTMTFADASGSTTSQAGLVVIDTATKSVIGQPILYGSPTEGPATNGVILASPDGRYVYTETLASGSGGVPTGTLWKIDTVAGTVQAVASGLYPSAPVLSPDGTRLYGPAVAVVDGQPQLAIGAVSTADGTMLTRIPIDTGSPTAVAVSPDGTRLYLGQLLGEAGQDPASLTGQLAVIDTGTSNAVTPPRAVNPITLIIRTVTNAVRASVQTIAHAINQNVASVSRLLGTVAGFAGSAIFETGLAWVSAAQALSQIGGKALGNILTAVNVAAAAVSGQFAKIPLILTGAVGDLYSYLAIRNWNAVGFLVGQAVSIWSYVFEQATKIDPRDIPGTLQYAAQNPGVVIRELAGATLTVGVKVATSVGGAVGGVRREAVALAGAVRNVTVDAARAVVTRVSSAGNAVVQGARTTVGVAARAATDVVNTVGRAATKTVDTVVGNARNALNAISKWRPWPFG
uniref:YncE family protein n=1 Tax=Mycobacterium sp. (strain JLS) TaxID=164757 RepID=A0A5Q5CBZ4_MYCSJ